MTINTKVVELFDTELDLETLEKVGFKANGYSEVLDTYVFNRVYEGHTQYLFASYNEENKVYFAKRLVR